MSKIKILPQHLINQIAAGEVVERPASVVKELVENCIDAGAHNISIEIENGGLSNIKIVDDGCGMNSEDAQMSILQHATSKLQSEEDLYKIATMGFRGEALASISSVSEFFLTTKETNALVGTSVEIRNSESFVKETGCASGTTIEVKNLFYNVPARKKYLKTAVTEFNHIADLFFYFSLLNHSISWKLLHNGNLIYHFPSGSWDERVSAVLGKEIFDFLIPVNISLNSISISGFIGKPQIARNNRKLQYLYVNDRPVNEFIIAKQIKDSFGTLISKDLYPVYILNLKIGAESVDVNVHPRKLEVRFSEPQTVYRTIYQVIGSILDENDLTKKFGAPQENSFQPLRQVFTQTAVKFNQPQFFAKPSGPQNPEQSRQSVDFSRFLVQTPVQSANLNNPEPEPPAYKIIGQVSNSYIIVETAEGIKIFDQHACSERVRYEQVTAEYLSGAVVSQRLLTPYNFDLPPQESHIIDDNLDKLQKLGFEIEKFGGHTFVIQALPAKMGIDEIKDFFVEICASLSEAETGAVAGIPDSIDRILKTMGCKSAIKFGDPLTFAGMNALLADLEKLANKYTCAHGRPCVIEYTFNDLERLFKRKN
jgi:DNA mismatch repair protein MutL